VQWRLRRCPPAFGSEGRIKSHKEVEALPARTGSSIARVWLDMVNAVMVCRRGAMSDHRPPVIRSFLRHIVCWGSCMFHGVRCVTAIWPCRSG